MPKSLSCISLLLITSSLHSAEKIQLSGELKQWHKLSLTLSGPQARETDTQPNPFTDLKLKVRFTHESGTPDYIVPGYFAADGDAGNSSANEGNRWRAHLSPDKSGNWKYTIHFKGTSLDGLTGNFHIQPTDKTGSDLRAKGRLQYVGKRYLRHAGNKQWFIKAGADSPETFLAYKDFDGTVANNPKKCPLKSWEPHVKDWESGDPTWQKGKGKGMIGAINYLASKGCNAFSFIPYNSGGDGDNVWPHVSREDKLHFDCSKLDQWGIVFDHANTKGMYLHFKLQETENDDLNGKTEEGKKQALDGGKLGPQRKAYLREMIARYGHNLALNWNIGEENTQSIEQIIEQAKFIREVDPYDHHIVLHTYPNQRDKIYNALVGNKEALSGVSIQNSNVANTHKHTLQWVRKSEESGHPWVVAFDEPGSAGIGTPPDSDWHGMPPAIKKSQKSKKSSQIPSGDDIRAQVLWGNLMAGGAGIEYYFGYKLPENDLLAEDWRSRDKLWTYSGLALKFFEQYKIPIGRMSNSNNLLVTNTNMSQNYCLSQAGSTYLIYLRQANNQKLNLSGTNKSFTVHWFDPRNGGNLQKGSVHSVQGGAAVNLGTPPSSPEKDWIVLIQSE